MKTVRGYLDLGLVFVSGDKCFKNGASGDEFHRHWHESPAMYSDKIASSFALRNNEGVKPEYKGLVEVEMKSGAVMRNKGVGNLMWSLTLGGHYIIAKWRPVVLQSESPAVSPKEDKPMKQFKTNQEANEIVKAHIDSMKPVYTAEMHAKGELPQVGADCILIVNDEPRLAKVTYIGKNIVCCSNVDGDAEYACLLGLVSFKPIIKTIKVNGFDVPAPMSEVPELGSEYFVIDMLDEGLFCSIEWEGDDKDNQWLSNGIIHSTKSAAIAHAKAMLGINPNPARGGDGYDRNVLSKTMKVMRFD